MFTFKESHTKQTVKSFSKMPFYQTMHNRMSAKKAKPALCFARIANAILGEVTLHNSSFLSSKKAQKNTVEISTVQTEKEGFEPSRRY